MELNKTILTEDIDNIIYEDESDSESKIPYEIPKEVRKITTQAYDKSVADIVRMIDEKDIKLDPEYQRNYVWDNKKASMLIESIILNVPIPVIYVSQEEDDSWSVIDGLQRLHSLKRFFDGKFRLSGLEILSELNKQDINTLNQKALRMLKNGLLRVIMITHDSNEEIKYDVFMRLNTGSVHLTEQELRNCLYRGTLNVLLRDMSYNKEWQTLLGLKEPHKRMADRELALRFLSICQGWDVERKQIKGYKGRMKVFLNDFMSQHQNINEKDKTKLHNLFDETVNKVTKVYGYDAFRLSSISGSKESAINRALMDILMLSASQHSLEDLEKNKERINSCLYSLIRENTDFANSLKIGTSDTKVITYRLELWCDKINEIISSSL